MHVRALAPARKCMRVCTLMYMYVPRTYTSTRTQCECPRQSVALSTLLLCSTIGLFYSIIGLLCLTLGLFYLQVREALMIARNTLQNGASIDVSNDRSLWINTRSHLPNTRSLFQVREALMIARDALQSGDGFDVGNADDGPAEEAGVYVCVCLCVCVCVCVCVYVIIIPLCVSLHICTYIAPEAKVLAAEANLSPKP
jgi:hypothetical protein